MEHYDLPMTTFHTIPLAQIYNGRETFEQYPKCQRDYVWKRASMRQRLIDSILRGIPIPPITVIPGPETLTGRMNYIVDGQQRIKTILDFMDDKFKTGSNRNLRTIQIDGPGLRFIEADKYYSELSDMMKHRVNSYPLQVAIVYNIPSEGIGLVFRRLNIQAKLTSAEKMYSYDTKPRDVYEDVQKHRFWDLMYVGNKDRKQAYMSVLAFIRLELYNGFCNLTTPQLLNVADGSQDNRIGKDMPSIIQKRLDDVMRLFDGFTARSQKVTVPMYQCALLLSESVSLGKVENGALAIWYGNLYQQALQNRREGSVMGDTRDFFAGMEKVNVQMEFWQREIPVIKEMIGNHKDAKRSFSPLDRVIAWNRQNGKCPVCGKTVQLNGEAHHIIPHAQGGNTSADNCAILHPRCHRSLHEDQQIKML